MPFRLSATIGGRRRAGRLLEMSVFGGDSWAKEAQNRKRRLEDLLLSSSPSVSHKKLSNGKLACLICPNTPVLDSPLALSMHNKGSRHIAAKSRMREGELSIKAELNKRVALAKEKSTNNPLIDGDRSRKAVATEQTEFGTSSDGGEESVVVVETNKEWRNRRQKELEFTAAGWKRDGHGKWYKDENVEFDSDEEDPNVYFS